MALAASARAWPDTLHRFLLDHGGGSVSTRVMGPQQALESDYQVLLIDDVCSFLSPRLVAKLRDSGREVVGVFSPDDGPDAKRRLLECGISDVVEMDAAPLEFLAVVESTLEHQTAASPRSFSEPTPGARIVVRGAATGVGCSEIAIGVATCLARDHRVILADVDQANPGLAQRLDLPLHPNLHTAVDHAHHDPARLADALLFKDGLVVVGGVARPDPDRQIQRQEIAALVEDLGGECDFLIVDVGSGQVEVNSDLQVVVGAADPVGISRLIWALEGNADDGGDTLAVINRVVPRTRKSDEIEEELRRAVPQVSLLMVPEDPRVRNASWDGVFVSRGRFSRSLRQVADLIASRILQ